MLPNACCKSVCSRTNSCIFSILARDVWMNFYVESNLSPTGNTRYWSCAFFRASLIGWASRLSSPSTFNAASRRGSGVGKAFVRTESWLGFRSCRIGTTLWNSWPGWLPWWCPSLVASWIPRRSGCDSGLVSVFATRFPFLRRECLLSNGGREVQRSDRMEFSGGSAIIVQEVFQVWDDEVALPPIPLQKSSQKKRDPSGLGGYVLLLQITERS